MAREYHRPPRVPNPQILDAAEQYFHACMILEKRSPGSPAGVLPLLQSAAIALELYLKCLGAEDVYVSIEDSGVEGLHKVHTKAARDHKLADLLGKIPDDIQSQLSDVFEARRPCPPAGSPRMPLRGSRAC